MKNKNIFNDMLFKNRFSLISLVIILAMYGILSVYYTPDSAVRNSVQTLSKGTMGSIGGSFQMTNNKGVPVTEKILNDKISLLFFGFTHCPDICPTALGKMNRVYEALPKMVQKDIQIIFVTLDPKRDTPEFLTDYMNAFNSNFTALYGTEKQTKKISNAYSVYYSKTTPDEHGDYTLDHTGYIYLMGTDGGYIQHFKHDENVKNILKDVMNAHSELLPKQNEKMPF